ncbi:MAG: glycosyltransferase family 4 protein [Gammaproteobacteria bacterium]
MAVSTSDAALVTSGVVRGERFSDAPKVQPTRRILFLTHVGDAGGAEYKMLDLCQGVRHSCEVMLFQHGSLESLLKERQIEFSVCPVPDKVLGVRREGGVLGSLRAIPGALSMVRSLARKAKAFDIVVCISQKSFVLASLAKPLMRRPILWFMNDILTPEHFSRSLIRFLVSLSRYSADHIALNSQASRDAWLQMGGRKERISIIYPGTSERQLTQQLQDPGRLSEYRARYRLDSAPLVGMFSRISPWKGQDVFLRALARLPHVRGLLVGGALFADQDHERRMKALAHELGVESRVTFAGHVHDPMTLMAICDVVAHCSTAPEPFGQVIAQAMFAGTPVIASDAGGAREIVMDGETGLLTPMNDPVALANAIQRYLEDPLWARRLARTAHSRAQEKFSAHAMTEGFLRALGTI